MILTFQKNALKALAISLLLVMILASCQNFGTKLEFKKGEVFYTNAANKEDAEKLGNFLVKNDVFTDEKKASVQLDHGNGDTNILRLVVLDGYMNDKEFEKTWARACPVIESEVFNNEPLLIQFCDKYFNPKKDIVPNRELTASSITGEWICSNIEGGKEPEAEKKAQLLAAARQSFRFQFKKDGTFSSDFLNQENPEQPIRLEGSYAVNDNKINMTNLSTNGQPVNDRITFDIAKNSDGLLLTSKQPNTPELRISFKPAD